MAVRVRRLVFRALVLISVGVGVFCTNRLYHKLYFILGLGSADGESSGTSQIAGQLKSLFMSEAECRITYPGLLQEIDNSVARGTFTFNRSQDDYTGHVQGRVTDGKLYIISAANDIAEEFLWRRSSILHSLHRAIITSPEILPDTPFSLVINDSPRDGSWSFSQSHSFDTNPPNSWVMPHFAGWSWPLPFIRSMDEALAEIETVEHEYYHKWEQKIDKISWRGTPHFNGIGIPDLRPKLLQITKGQEWADVEALEWIGDGAKNAKNALRIEDFCKYRYIAYTEGITYSGRLQFHQACASIILTPPITHLQHTSHLIRPLFSSDLALPCSQLSKSCPWKPSRSANATWPVHYSPSEANIIFVSPDWSDLESVIMYLRSNPRVAAGIARRQREFYVTGGYFSTAAEVCYWRGLLRGWSKVATIDEGNGGDWEGGIRWESFVVTGRINWGKA